MHHTSTAHATTPAINPASKKQPLPLSSPIYHPPRGQAGGSSAPPARSKGDRPVVEVDDAGIAGRVVVDGNAGMRVGVAATVGSAHVQGVTAPVVNVGGNVVARERQL